MIELLITVILQCILYFTVFCIFAKPRSYRFKYSEGIIIAVLLGIASAAFFFIGKLMVIITMCTCILTGLLFFKNTLSKSLNSLSISFVTYLLIDYLVVFILSIFERKYGFYTNNIVYAIISAIPVISVCFFLRKLIKNLEDSILASITTTIMIIVYGINIYSMKIEMNTENVLFIFIVFITIIILALLLLTLYYRRQQKLYLKQYYGELENSFNDIREFRHDYKNLIVTLGMLVENEDLQGIKTFYNSMTEYQKNEIISGSHNLERLTRIRIDYLRGFLFSKIREAESRNVDVFVEVSGKIESVNMNRVDLVRVLGIILDNAIEEVETIGRGTVSIILIKIDSGVVISVENDCREDIERVHQLREKNFSSKGEKRGLGLYILDEILRKENQIHHELRIENGKFIQKLEIKDKS